MKESSVERHLYRSDLSGNDLKKISKKSGVHSISCSPNGEYYLDKFSDSNTPPNLSLYNIEGELIKVIDESQIELISKINLQTPEIFTIPTKDGFPMPAQILKPYNFDDKKKYPQFIMFMVGHLPLQFLMAGKGPAFFTIIYYSKMDT